MENIFSMSRRNMLRRSGAVITFVFLFLLTFDVGTAQQCGDVALNEAKKKYETGNFDKVADLLLPCLENGFSDDEKVQAFRLLAMTSIALDDTASAKGTIGKLLKINQNFAPNLFDPPQFIEFVNEIKQRDTKVKITSVSKKIENILEAPATVAILNGEDLRSRGYTDLEQVLHDLSGFDISRSNGIMYSNVYERGYRSSNTDRILFLIDGVEDNELWSNFLFVTRQYPISNIKRIEIIYGPASTMYGANAFSGVINIITKDADELLTGDKKIGIKAQLGYGSFATKYADVTLATKYKDLTFSLTARSFLSDEKDLSSYSDWDYQPETLEFYKSKLSVTGMTGTKYNAQDYITKNKLPGSSPYYTIVKKDTLASELLLTDAGAAKARAYDSVAMAQTVNGHPVNVSDYSNDRLVYGKMNVGNFTLGFQWWKVAEGATPSYTDRYYSGSENGTQWSTRGMFLYAKYNVDVNDKLSLMSFTQYRQYSFGNDAQLTRFNSYSSVTYSIKDLVANKASNWAVTNFLQTCDQIRSELKALYIFSPEFDVVGGFEFRHSNLQGDYIRSSVGNPEEVGFPPDSVPGSNNFSSLDLGLYAQAGYKLWSSLNLTLGGRFDMNSVRNISKTIFNPRAAIVYSLDRFVFKLIYAEAYFMPTFQQRFSTTTSRRLNNPTLEAEKVRNIDIAANYSIGQDIAVEATFYQSKYDNVVNTVVVPFGTGTTTQNQNTAEIEILGAQAMATWKFGNYSIFGNATYTKPTDKTLDLPVGDIAPLSFNLGVNGTFFEKFTADIRMNFVGEKKTGKETTIRDNPLKSIDSYMILNGTLTATHVFAGLSAQVLCNNILNLEYYDPGIRAADGLIQAARLPQNERNFVLRILYDL